MNKFNKSIKGNIVYSTNKDFKPEFEEERESSPLESGSQVLKVWLEKNSMGGKIV